MRRTKFQTPLFAFCVSDKKHKLGIRCWNLLSPKLQNHRLNASEYWEQGYKNLLSASNNLNVLRRRVRPALEELQSRWFLISALCKCGQSWQEQSHEITCYCYWVTSWKWAHIDWHTGAVEKFPVDIPGIVDEASVAYTCSFSLDDKKPNLMLLALFLTWYSSKWKQIMFRSWCTKYRAKKNIITFTKFPSLRNEFILETYG